MRVRYSVYPSDFVLHLEKTLFQYGKFFNGVCVAYTILNPLEKRKQQLDLHGYTKKLIVNILYDKNNVKQFFLSYKNFFKKKTFFMQNVSVWLIRRDLEVLAFMLWYRSNEFPVIRLQEHQAIEQDDKERSSCL